MSDSIGYVTLQVIPSMKGIEGNLKTQLGAPIVAAGKKAGKDAGEAIAQGLESAKAKVEAASKKLATARDKEADAAGKVKVAEKQLDEVRSNSRAKQSQIIAATEKYEAAQRKAAAASKDATDATKKLADATKSLGEASKTSESSGKKFGEGFLSGTTGALGKLGDIASGSGMEMGGNLLSAVGDGVSSLGSKAGPIGMALTAAIGTTIGIGVTMGKALYGAIQEGMQPEIHQDLLQAQLGINEETAARIGKAAGAAYGNVFGESVAGNMDAAKAAIQSGLLGGEESAPEIQAMVERLTTVSDLMGEDIPAVAKSAGQAMKTGIVKDGVGALDLLTVATQKGLNINEDLLDTVNEYGTQFRKLGFDGVDAMGLISQAVKNGARDTDVAADAIKEFSIRVVDGSNTTQDAYDILGLNLDEMTRKFLAGGETARDAFIEVSDKIRALDDPVKRNTVSLELFGTQAEDLGGALGAMDLNNAVRQFGNVGGAADRAAQIIGDNPAAKLEQAKRSIEQSSTAIKVALADAFGPSLARIADWVTTHQPEILGFFQQLGDAAFSVLDGFLAFADGSLSVLIPWSEGIAKVFSGVAKGLGYFLEGLGSLVSVVPGMESVGDAISGAGDKLLSFSDQMNKLPDAYRREQSAIKDIREGLTGIRTDFDNASGAAITSAEQMRMFGGAVEQVPDSKDVKIHALSDEAKKLVDEFKLKVTTLPDGTSIIHADTAEGQAELDRWIAANNNRSVDVVLNIAQGQGQAIGATTTEQLLMPFQHARGGYIRGPGTGTSDSIPARLSDGEYVMRSAAVGRYGRGLFDSLNAMRFAAGGMVDKDAAVAYAKAHNGEPYVYGGLDCSGYQSGIYSALTGNSVRFTTDSDFSQYGFVSGFDPNGYSIGTNGGSGPDGHMAGTLYGVNVESNGSDGILYGDGALGASDFPMVFYLPGASQTAASAPAAPAPPQSGGVGTAPKSGGTDFTPGGAADSTPATPEPTEQEQDYAAARKSWPEKWNAAGSAALSGQFAGTPFENAYNRGSTVVNFVQKDLTEAFDKWKRYQNAQAASVVRV